MELPKTPCTQELAKLFAAGAPATAAAFRALDDMRRKMAIDMDAAFAKAMDRHRREEAMRDRFARQPFMPCTLEDEERHDSGRAYMARDTGGSLHLIGRNPEVAAKRQANN
jgi:hypothetical protein